MTQAPWIGACLWIDEPHSETARTMLREPCLEMACTYERLLIHAARRVNSKMVFSYPFSSDRTPMGPGLTFLTLRA